MSKKQTINIEYRLLDAKGTCKDHQVQRVVKQLGSTDHWVSFKGTVVPVNKRSNGTWYGVFYG
jgi:hypothetical protein